MRAAARAAATSLLDGYVTANPGALRQTFPTRPLTIHAPAGFVDAIEEEQARTPGLRQRTVDCVVRIVRGTYSSGDVAEANDELVDGLVEYIEDNPHAAGANTMCDFIRANDEDQWIPEWIDPGPGNEARAYYSTLVTVRFEGLFGT